MAAHSNVHRGLLLGGLLIVPLLGQAMPIAGQGTWEETLLGRDLTGDGNADAFYDTVLDITWLADANLAGTETFGVDSIDADGTMTWFTANDWIAAMNDASHLGFDDWRLPLLAPVNGDEFTADFIANDASIDFGYARTTTDGSDGGWRDGDGNPVSEMGHMFYVNLGNLGFCEPNDESPESCIAQTGWGLHNTAEFSSIQVGRYWTSVDFVLDGVTTGAWDFRFDNAGLQSSSLKTSELLVWAVRPGDVAAVPEPGFLTLLATGLLGLFGLKQRNKGVGPNQVIDLIDVHSMQLEALNALGSKGYFGLTLSWGQTTVDPGKPMIHADPLP